MDLLSFGAPPIEWDETGMKGIASDGRPVSIEVSILTGRWVASLPVFGRDCMTRRAAKTPEAARAMAERAIGESQ